MPMNNFTPVLDYKVERVPLGMGNLSLKLLPPRKSRSGVFYPTTNFNNYSTQTYSNLTDGYSVNVRYRVFVSISLPDVTNRNARPNEIVYSMDRANEIAASAQQFIQVVNDANSKGGFFNGSNEYAGYVWQSATFTGGKDQLFIKPNQFNIGQNTVNGYAISIGATGQYSENITENQMVSLMKILANPNYLPEHEDTLILGYQNAMIQASLDALLVHNQVFSGVNYKNPTDLIGGGMTGGSTSGFGAAPASGFTPFGGSSSTATPGFGAVSNPFDTPSQPQGGFTSTSNPFDSANLTTDIPAAGLDNPFATPSANTQPAGPAVEQPVAPAQPAPQVEQQPAAPQPEPETKVTDLPDMDALASALNSVVDEAPSQPTKLTEEAPKAEEKTETAQPVDSNPIADLNNYNGDGGEFKSLFDGVDLDAE